MTSRIRDFETIVLLHGLGRTRLSMLPLAMSLRRLGIEIIRLGYPSTQMSLHEARAHVAAHLPSNSHAIVGHSLGGLIGAQLLRAGRPGLERVVQLGSPNLGSVMAERMGPVWPVRRMCGPALQDLKPHDDVPTTDPRIGAVAGTAGGMLPGLGLESPHDGAVSLRSAHAGAGHCTRVPVLHTVLPASPAAGRQVRAFLATGRFMD